MNSYAERSHTAVHPMLLYFRFDPFKELENLSPKLPTEFLAQLINPDILSVNPSRFPSRDILDTSGSIM